VTILDANLLLYAYNESAPEQVAAAEWLTKLLESGETIALPWVSIWAFLRISTNARIFPNARSAKEAFEIISEWLSQPGVVLLQPGLRHFEILERLALRYAVNGPLLADAVLAALAVENGAVLASSDQDFRRFPEVRWMNPLAEV
jgi:toxin-antitoxin system PIN domain toxin